MQMREVRERAREAGSETGQTEADDDDDDDYMTAAGGWKRTRIMTRRLAVRTIYLSLVTVISNKTYSKNQRSSDIK